MNQVIGKTIQRDKQLWRVMRGDWYVQCFGWHPTGINPRYSWLHVQDKDVPQDVKEMV